MRNIIATITTLVMLTGCGSVPDDLFGDGPIVVNTPAADAPVADAGTVACPDVPEPVTPDAGPMAPDGGPCVTTSIVCLDIAGDVGYPIIRPSGMCTTDWCSGQTPLVTCAWTIGAPSTAICQ